MICISKGVKNSMKPISSQVRIHVLIAMRGYKTISMTKQASARVLKYVHMHKTTFSSKKLCRVYCAHVLGKHAFVQGIIHNLLVFQIYLSVCM